MSRTLRAGAAGAALTSAATLLLLPAPASARQAGAGGNRAAAAVQRELNAIYARTVEAYKRRDVQGVMAATTPDYRAILDRKKGLTLSRKQVEENTKRQLASTVFINEARQWVERVNLRGDTAEAEVRSRIALLVTGGRGGANAPGTRGQLRSVIEEARWKDTWTRTAAGWKNKRSELVAQRVLVDGVPLPR